MAKLVITEHSGRISPVFDVASTVQIIEFEDGKEAVARVQIPLRSTDPLLRAKEVCGLGASVIICGAISRPLEEALLTSGLKVFSFLCGQIDEVVAAFLSGRFPAASFAMPGCCGRRNARQGAGNGLHRRQRGRCRGGSRRQHRQTGASSLVFPATQKIEFLWTCEKCGYKETAALLGPEQVVMCPKCEGVMTHAVQ